MDTSERILFSLVLASLCASSDKMPGNDDHTVSYNVEGVSDIIHETDITCIEECGTEEIKTDTPVACGYSFMASPRAELPLTAVLHDSGTTTLNATITVDNTCLIDERTFVTDHMFLYMVDLMTAC